MIQELKTGGNISLSSSKGSVIVTHDIDKNIDVSLTAFLVTDAGKVLGDSGIVFYNQMEGPNGIATFIPSEDSGSTKTHKIDFDLSKSSGGITKIAVTLTEGNNTGFASVKNLKAEIQVGSDVIQLIPSSFTTENGIVVTELYLRSGSAKAKAVWKGFAAGLDGLCLNYGVEVEAEEKQPVQPVKSVVNLKKTSGKVNLSKGEKPILIEKTTQITASVSWDSGTDYDIYALVYTKSGKQIDVAMFGAKGVPVLQNFDNGTVEHMGDVGRGKKLGWGKAKKEVSKTETIKMRFNDDIIAVVPVAYSAQSNGSGSFHKYKVSMCIDNNAGTEVTISAENANNNNGIYTCVPGMLLNTPDGVIIKPIEMYSTQGSENRPKLEEGADGNIEIVMDKGPKNNYK
ncbi:TerD family protein [Clostridium tagluense]|uniref:TerD family protein n=1 Tax=Clostridium tagluense TaxID=360422 RepID=UPI001C0B93DB|nr:TerD family protein [Clostridium tagluense]MBU3128014.1 TerD family protein [Clostridium tagluense]